MHQQEITTKIKQAIKEVYGFEPENILIERPAQEEHGDYATNVVLTIAPRVKKPPIEIAEEIAEKLKIENGELKINTAKPGFINFTQTDKALISSLNEVLKQGDSYGSLDIGQNEKINVEFVSANPTGPLHIGNFRGGPLGDVIANVLIKAGYSVTKEYYHNDLGEQVRKLGESILYWQKKQAGEEYEFPEGGYEGDYVKDLSSKLKAQNLELNLKAEKLSYPSSEEPKATSREARSEKSSRLGSTLARTINEDTVTQLGKQAVGLYFKKALEISEKAGIKFDTVSKESEIEASGKTAAALEILNKKGYLKEKDGATWFAKEDEFLGDRECVVKKSNGNYTYFGNDLGYHLDKHQRGYIKVIDIWGANHHGHVVRMKSGMDALGFGAQWLEIPLYQWVTIIRGGKTVSMSKRSGNFITAEEVLEEVGKDALRWFFLSRDANTHIQFDLDLAKEQSKKNPVYYVQYAHARICSLLKKAGANPVETGHAPSLQNAEFTPEERSLIRELIYFPELIEEISYTLGVHKLTLYATAIADKFHKFYETCKIINDPKQEQRLAIVKTTQIVLSCTLNLLGMTSPEKM